MNLVIDAHQHFWQRGRDPFDYDWLESPGNEAICRNFLPAVVGGYGREDPSEIQISAFRHGIFS